MEFFIDTAASRDRVQVAQAALGSADIATIPPKTLHRMVARALPAAPIERSLRWASHRGAPRTSAGADRSR
jgi:transaldolase